MEEGIEIKGRKEEEKEDKVVGRIEQEKERKKEGGEEM